ncbi:G2/M phase-specific E3 ubiquitin-protein ligase-like [Sinocyclocheilus anshuiensis]|uniref:G2/M phase-specific E3 ubiquitin-protein ligase-like n=1 Tax=Sinocyclocheilus anshuiensis TaxID=1608454 RepID=UPI0007B7E6E2|nr:PREDICTED: G2/M phase-specific E3 ubiquitin-protein ligase-like [Sinocyclocheilus anshuiensis]
MRYLQSRVRQRALPANQVNVLRGEEFDCAVRAFSWSAFDPESRLDLVFVDESGVGKGAVDEALHNGVYRLAGQMVAVCLIQGGVSPHFSSHRRFRQICGLPSLPPSIEEVADPEFQDKLCKLCAFHSFSYQIASAVTLENAREAISGATDELTVMGALCYCYLNSMTQRDELMTAILEFYTEGRIYAALQQFKEGLNVLGLIDDMIAHHTAFEEVFFKSNVKLTAADIVGLFKPQFTSPRGSNKRRQESRAVAFWRDWLLEVEGKTAFNGQSSPFLYLERMPLKTVTGYGSFGRTTEEVSGTN